MTTNHRIQALCVMSHWEEQQKMASSNNPRKFSEKIALHNQKQAEETAAFEEVMKDLNITRAARVSALFCWLITVCSLAR